MVADVVKTLTRCVSKITLWNLSQKFQQLFNENSVYWFTEIPSIKSKTYIRFVNEIGNFFIASWIPVWLVNFGVKQQFGMRQWLKCQTEAKLW